MMGSNLPKSRISKIRKIRTLENRVSLRKLLRFLMKWSFVQHLGVIKPSSILICQGASIGKGLRFFKWFQSDFFKNRLKL